MNTQRHSGGLPELARTWTLLQGQVFLKPIRDERDYQKMVAFANELADQLQEENGPLDDLYDLVTELIGMWEDQHVDIPAAEPREVLRYLLETHDLKQKDLAEIASPTLISDILAGRRAISRSVAKALAERFSTDVSVFL